MGEYPVVKMNPQRLLMEMHSSLYEKHGKKCHLQAGRLLWHAKPQQCSVLACGSNKPTLTLLASRRGKRQLLPRLHQYNSQSRDRCFLQRLWTARNVLLQQQSTRRKKVLTRLWQHSSKCTLTRAIRCVTRWYSVCCRSYIPSELNSQAGRSWSLWRSSCISSHSDKQQTVLTHGKVSTGLSRKEIPADTADDAAVPPDLASNAVSCSTSSHSAGLSDFAADNVLSIEELLRVLRGMRNNTRSRTAARCKDSFQRKPSCVSAAHRPSPGGKSAACTPESASLPNEKDLSWSVSNSSPPEPAPAACTASHSSDAAYSCTASLSSGSVASAFRDSRDQWSTANISRDVSAAYPQKNLSLESASSPRLHPLRRSCLYRSLLYHLRRPSPGCYSSLHLYAVSGLPVEPLMPELPQLVLKLLRLNAFSTTKELALCLHACTTLLRNSLAKGNQGMEAHASEKFTNRGDTPADQAAPPNIPREAWLSLCLAFETTFCQRLQQQFDHTHMFLQRSSTSKTQHPNSHWRNETLCGTRRRRHGYGGMFAGTSEPKKTSENESFITSVSRTASLRSVDTSSTYHVRKCTALHCNVKSRSDFPPSNDDGKAISAPCCPSASPRLVRDSPVEVFPSHSWDDGGFSRVNALETSASRKPSVYPGATARDSLCTHLSSGQMSEETAAAITNLQEETPSSLQKPEAKLCQRHIPFPHIVVPQDLSMFLSSYVILAKHNHYPVSESLIAAAACYLFLYSGYSSPQAFTLGTCVVAKVAATHLAGTAASCVPSPPGTASFVRKVPCQHMPCVLLCPNIGPFTSDVTARGSSTNCTLDADELKGINEASSAQTHLRSPPFSPRKEEKGGDGDCQTTRSRQFFARNCFSPLQLLTAVLHHWVIENANTLRPHDWACVLQALRFLLRVRSSSPPLTVPNPGGTLFEDASCNTKCTETSDVCPLHASCCRESSTTYADSSSATRVSFREEAPFSVSCASGSASLHFSEHRGASGQQPEHAQQSGIRSKSENVEVDSLQESTQLRVWNGESRYLRDHAQRGRVAAVRAAKRTVAAAASAFSELPSLMSPFSVIAAAVPSCFLPFRSAPQQILDLPQSRKVRSNSLRHAHSSDRQALSGASARAVPAGLPVATSRDTASSLVTAAAADAAVTADGCNDVKEDESELSRTRDATHDDTQVYALAQPIPLPSADELLRAVRHILLLLQQRLNAAMTLTSLPVLTLAAVQLHDALVEKVYGVQAHAALRQREHGWGSGVGSGARRSTQEGQVKQVVPLTRTCREKGAKVEKSYKQNCSEETSDSSKTLAVSSISGLFAPVYELVCQTLEARLVSDGLPSEWHDRFSGCSIVVSALVDALHLGAVENAYKKAEEETTAAEGHAQGDVVLDTERPDVVPLYDGAQSNSAVYDEVEGTTARLQSTVLRLFRHAVLNVFLQKSSLSGFSTFGRYSVAAPLSFDVTHVSPEGLDIANSDSFIVNAKDTAAPLPQTTTSCQSFPRLAWCPTPQDLVDLVKAAASLFTSFASLDGCDKRPKAASKFHSSRNASSLDGCDKRPEPANKFHGNGNAPSLDGCDEGPQAANKFYGNKKAWSLTDGRIDNCVPSYLNPVEVATDEKDRVSFLPQNVSSKAQIIENVEQQHILLLLLRACCDHVVNVLKHQLGQGRTCHGKADGLAGAPVTHEGNLRTFLLPRDVSSLALHFHRCNLLSAVEFDTFGRYITAIGHGGDGDLHSPSKVLSGHDFVCLLQIFIRPETPETYRIGDATYEEQLLPTEGRAQRDAWQSPFAVRLAVVMLDGILPRSLRTFDDMSLAKLTLWLGSKFQKLQVHDRCSRSTTRGGNSDELITEDSQDSGSYSLHAPAPRIVRDASMIARTSCRLQLPAMRGMLERATRHVVQELLRRFCGVQVNGISSLSGDRAQALEQPSVDDSKRASAANCSSKCVATTMLSVPPGPVPVACGTTQSEVWWRQNFSNSGRVCVEPQAYVTLLVGLSKLPRDLLLLSDSSVASKVRVNNVNEKGRCNFNFHKRSESRSAQRGGTAGTHLQGHPPPGMFLLRSLLSRQQVQLFFVPRAVLTDWQLKMFFSALQHLPVGGPNDSLSTAAEAAQKESKDILHWEYRLCTSTANCLKQSNSEYTSEPPTLREFVLHTVFQGILLGKIPCEQTM